MIKKYIFLILFSFIYSNSPVNNFIIGFWPEYDHPGVLVSIQVESNLNNLPFEFILDVPKNAKMVIETVIDSLGRNNNVLNIESNNDSSYISTIINTQKYLLQYYFNPFESDDYHRNIEYFLSANVDLVNFYVVIQKHLGALEYQINLKNMETIEDRYGITYYRKKIDKLFSNDSLMINIKYQNPSNITTMEILNQEMEKSKIQNNVLMNNNITIDNKNIYYKNKIYILIIMALTTIAIMILYLMYNKENHSAVSFSSCKECKKMIKKTDSFCSYCGGKNVS